jgi:hypothetical protein
MSLSVNSSSKATTPPRGHHRRPRGESVGGGVSLQRIPVPVSLQLFNPYPGPLSIEETTRQGARLDYSTDLLRPIQAEIVELVDRTREDDKSSNEYKEARVLFACPVDHTACATTSPCWSHLVEALDWETLDRSTYERVHMRFRLVLVDDDTEDDNLPATSFFLTIPLHPSKLIPLQKEPPTNRPLNTALVQFSDDSLRITPLVLEQLQNQPSGQSHETLAVADEQLLRFEEDAFRALDSVVTCLSSMDAPRTPGGTSLLDVAEQGEEGPPMLTVPPPAEATPEEDSLLVSNGAAEEQLLENLSLLPPVSSGRLAELAQERDALAASVQHERQALQDGNDEWQADQAKARAALEDLRTTEAQTAQIRKAVEEEQRESRRLLLLQEAHRIRLLKELRRIYPITIAEGQQGQKIFKIRGLTLPRDIFTIPEDELSAALGFLCHCVTLLSRYLTVPLRYRLFCNSSRSAVQDDRGTVFPLFQARPVERDQVEHGVLLLGRNVECIGASRGIRRDAEKPLLHVLEKVQTIYDNVVNGDPAK